MKVEGVAHVVIDLEPGIASVTNTTAALQVHAQTSRHSSHALRPDPEYTLILEPECPPFSEHAGCNRGRRL